MPIKLPNTPMVNGDNEAFYPLTHARQVVLNDGSRLEKGGKINADTASTADKLGGKAPEYYVQPRNLLDNSDFRNPVNQRGVTEWNNVEWAYTIDRWQIWHDASPTTSAKLTGDGMQFTHSLYQNLPISPDKTYTFAAMIDGVLHICTGVPSQSPTNVIVGMLKTTDGLAQVWMNASYDGGGAKTVQWAALYEGIYAAETLPPYRPKGYAAELHECQRYYLPLSGMYNVFCLASSGLFYVQLDTPIEMRSGANPSINLPINVNNYIILSDGTTITGASFNLINRTKTRGFLLHFAPIPAVSKTMNGVLEIDSLDSYISLDL